MEKAIHYFKELSSFNNQYAKNNLAIIYKNGFGVKKNISYTIEYLTEAINKKNDYTSMYNLAKIYFYGEDVNKNIDKSIELLIRSLKKCFLQSLALLSLALIEKIKNISFQSICDEIMKYENENYTMAMNVLNYIKENNLDNSEYYQYNYAKYQKVEYMYRQSKKVITSSEFWTQKLKNKKDTNKHLLSKQKEVNTYFYLGFDETL